MRLIQFIAVCCLFSSISALDIGDQGPGLGTAIWVTGGPTEPGGEVTLIELWSTAYAPCLQVIPQLTALQKKHPDRLKVIALTTENLDVVKSFVEKAGDALDYRIAVVEGKLYEQWKGANQEVPFSYLLDRKGTILWSGHPISVAPALTLALAGKLDVANGKKLRQATDELFKALNSKESDLPNALMRSAAVLAIAPADEHTIRLRLAIAKQLKDYDSYQRTLAQVPVAEIEPQQLSLLCRELLAEEELIWRNTAYAVGFAADAFRRSPNDPGAVDSYARALAAIGQFDAAIAVEKIAVDALVGAKATQTNAEAAVALAQNLEHFKRLKELQTTHKPATLVTTP